jgi:alanyl-tRNA synthetase
MEQKGSLVNPNNLRFDFSHFSKVTDEELQQVEVLLMLESGQLPLIEQRYSFRSSGRRGSNGFVW